MPRRKRKDPIDTPINGDYSKDIVLNKREDRAYALVAQEDIPVMIGRGYTRTTRPDKDDGTSTRPAFDMGGDGDYSVGGQLVLMETPVERAEAIQRDAEKRFAVRSRGLRDQINQHVAANPGSKFYAGNNIHQAG